jgi:hypothetical protein
MRRELKKTLLCLKYRYKQLIDVQLENIKNENEFAIAV